jgi:hypothetical protein
VLSTDLPNTQTIEAFTNSKHRCLTLIHIRIGARINTTGVEVRILKVNWERGHTVRIIARGVNRETGAVMHITGPDTTIKRAVVVRGTKEMSIREETMETTEAGINQEPISNNIKVSSINAKTTILKLTKVGTSNNSICKIPLLISKLNSNNSLSLTILAIT